MMPDDEQQSRAPWERLLPADGKRGESYEAFAAFCAYCKSPKGEDNLRRLATTLGKNRSLLYRWSLRHRWPTRRSSWRDHLARKDCEEIERLQREKTAKSAKRREQEAEEQYQDAQLLRRKARQMLEYPLSEKTVRGPEGKTFVVKPSRWSMDTGASLMRTAANLGSRALEEPSSAVQDQVEEKIELEALTEFTRSLTGGSVWITQAILHRVVRPFFDKGRRDGP
jgi:hypothetical protein